ncbi:hypothetical protein PENTCL1PPCAC_3983, partial [Pristionchus entomophagus]
LRLDLVESKQLLAMATRPTNKNYQKKRVARLDAEVAKGEKVLSVFAKSTGFSTLQISIKDVGEWLNAEKFVKITVKLPGVGKLADEDICCWFTDTSFCLWAIMDGKKHELLIKNLLYEIIPEESYLRHVKGCDEVVATCRKKDFIKWNYLTKTQDGGDL